MIDWDASNIVQSKVKCSDNVIVICEKCNKSRTILYNRAKRLDIHLCQSCSNKKDGIVTKQMVEYTCIDCKCTKIQPYRASRYNNWRCKLCGIKKAQKDNKYIGSHNRNITIKTRSKISKASRDKWQDNIYRNALLHKMSVNSKSKRKENRVSVTCANCGQPKIIARRRLSDLSKRVCKKCAMMKKWNNPEYRNLISSGQREISKKLWNDINYRQKVVSSNSRIWSLRKHELSIRAKELWKNDGYRLNMATALSMQLKQPSSIQRLLYKYLDDLGIKYEVEYPLGFYVFDCFIPDKKLLIECQGDYWHTLPKAERNDKSKFTYIKRYFQEYEIMYVWEHEFAANNRVLDRLKLKLGLSLDIVDFNFEDVIIRTPDSKELKSFLDAYHYIGKDRGGNCFGAYFNGELIGCVVYSPPLRQNTAGQFNLSSSEVCELSRLCIHPNYQKKNFASWLIARTIKKINFKLVISYADTTVGHTGTIYRAAGFDFHHKVDSDYWYVDKDGYVMHKRTLYGKAIKMGIKEAEYANKFGYLKKYGGEKLCFTKNLMRL